MALDPWTYAKPNSEHSQQVALLMWANMACRYGLHVANHAEAYTVQGWAIKNAKGDLVPQLKWLHAIHNQGHGDAVRGAKAKAEGVKAGVFDLFLPVPISLDGKPAGKLYDDAFNACHAGFYLELKVGDNKPSEKQIEFADDMRAAGYHTDVAWDWLEARERILAYLQIGA